MEPISYSARAIVSLPKPLEMEDDRFQALMKGSLHPSEVESFQLLNALLDSQAFAASLSDGKFANLSYYDWKDIAHIIVKFPMRTDPDYIAPLALWTLDHLREIGRFFQDDLSRFSKPSTLSGDPREPFHCPVGFLKRDVLFHNGKNLGEISFNRKRKADELEETPHGIGMHRSKGAEVWCVFEGTSPTFTLCDTRGEWVNEDDVQLFPSLDIVGCLAFGLSRHEEYDRQVVKRYNGDVIVRAARWALFLKRMPALVTVNNEAHSGYQTPRSAAELHAELLRPGEYGAVVENMLKGRFDGMQLVVDRHYGIR